ncbi:MAG TPA: arginine--tRNA ligase [Firmicutes bacterium]|nr:arginine--tRNA ligase [Bacillota bacterium]
MDYRKRICELINDPLVTETDVVTAAEGHGDFALPCFKYARELRKSPQAIAQDFAARLPECGFIERTEVAGGYLNFYLDRAGRVRDVLTEREGKAELAALRESNAGKTVCIDYSSINIAKPFHIGHLMSTAIGGSLYRIYKYLGWKPVGINHLGDWGTQFGKLLAAYEKWGDKSRPLTLNDMLSLYVRFTEESEKDPELAERGRTEFLRIERGEPDAVGTYELFKSTTLAEVNKVYDRLGIVFDSYNGEAFYNDKMQLIIDELDAKGLTEISDGAKIVRLDDYGMPPCLITRSDGATLYATRDLAAAEYRAKTYRFAKSLYVVATQQNLHFRQLFKVLELMGREWAKDLVHVQFGMVSYEGQPLSTRHGHVVFLADVIENTVSAARRIIEEKNPALENKEETAESVGVGAVMFFALGTQRIKDVDFNYDKVLSFEGETAPYLQYTHARCRSVLAKADKPADYDPALLTDDDSYAVIKLLADWNDTVREAAEKYEPSIVARRLIDIAQAYNRFYISGRIITDDAPLTAARLKLTETVADTLREGLDLLLIKAPDRM